MKTALLSFHNAYNYGAALQAYALQCWLQQNGFECEYINYINPHRHASYNVFKQAKNNFKNKNYIRAAILSISFPLMKRRAHKFEKFYTRLLCKTDKIYRTSEEAAALENIYDKFIVGSDQVWNPEHNGRDLAFLLNFISDENKKIAYSSSFGTAGIPDDLKNGYAENLKNIKYLATREKSGAKLVKELTGKTVGVVLDPVFLPEKKHWESLISAKKSKHPFVFLYTNKKGQIQDFLDIGYDVKDYYLDILSTHVSVKELLNKRMRIKATIAPEEFLWEIKNAELVVTASFHCLAFSIIFHKPFLAILTGNKGKDERLLNLLRITGLENRILKPGVTAPLDVNDKIDYQAVEERLQKYRINSKEFLIHALKGKDLNIDWFDSEDESDNKNECFEICPSESCTGCGACAQTCPASAVRMEYDSEGFLAPVINGQKCTGCNACKKVCHINCPIADEPFEQSYYAVKNTDKIRAKSSSGGVFTALSDAVLEEGGVVCAASLKEQFYVKHSIAYTKKERDAMCKTFYVQSDTSDIYREVKNMLDKKTKVLFVGTPCQVAGLISYIGGKNNLLLTVDLICHGAPSPLCFKAFYDYLKTKKSGDLSEFNFRDKALGWKGYTVSAVYGGKKVKNKQWLQSFNSLFSKSYINRLSCSSCRYTDYERVGDITIGDFWGVEKQASHFNDNKGISLVIVNSEAGSSIFEKCKEIEFLKMKKEQTLQNSLSHPKQAPNDREKCISLILNGKYEKASVTYGENNLKGKVKSLIRKLIIYFNGLK